MAQAPRTRYAKCGDIDIAYQVFGDGPVDLLVLPGPFIPFDSIEAEPRLYRFHRRLASFARVIRFDQRGMGLSSRASLDEIGPEFWAEDAIAVMDAAGCDQATIFASGYTAMSGLVLAAEHPERVRSLVIVNGAPRIRWAPDYEPGVDASRVDPFTTVGIEPDAVEQGFDALGTIAPTVAGDEARVSRHWRVPARCSCHRRCVKSSPGRGATSPSEASTTSRACRVAGVCTVWSGAALSKV